MDPVRFRRLCAGLHRLSPRQVSEIEARLAGLGARTEVLAGLDRRGLPRLRAHLLGLGGLAARRAAPARGVPRGAP
mgnify:CR=1 FL=1